MMALHKVNHMNEADHQIVSDAVSAAEAHTNGEIVTIVTDYSDHYGDVANLWASIAAFASLSAMALFPKFLAYSIGHQADGSMTIRLVHIWDSYLPLWRSNGLSCGLS
jgi:uncharacterized membrane protein